MESITNITMNTRTTTTNHHQHTLYRKKISPPFFKNMKYLMKGLTAN